VAALARVLNLDLSELARTLDDFDDRPRPADLTA
jgi:hypothetical protein